MGTDSTLQGGFEQLPLLEIALSLIVWERIWSRIRTLDWVMWDRFSRETGLSEKPGEKSTGTALIPPMDSRFLINVFLNNRFSGLFSGQIKTPIFWAFASRIGGLIVSWRTISGVEHPARKKEERTKKIPEIRKKRGIFTFVVPMGEKTIFQGERCASRQERAHQNDGSPMSLLVCWKNLVIILYNPCVSIFSCQTGRGAAW